MYPEATLLRIAVYATGLSVVYVCIHHDISYHGVNLLTLKQGCVPGTLSASTPSAE